VSTSGKSALLVVIILSMAFSGSVFAQNPGASQPASAPAAAADGVVYGGGAYLAPSATLPAQNSGISLGDRTGISLDSPLQTAVTTAVPATAGLAQSAPAPETGRAINDLGPSYYAGAGPADASATAAPSLGEIAARYKANRRQNVRVYTNADAERMVANVKTGSGSFQAAAPQSGSTQVAQNSPGPATMALVTPPANPSPSATAVQSQAASQPASPTTPQVSQPSQSREQSNESLPATATLLPFLGLLGLLSGGAGLWLMKFRK